MPSLENINLNVHAGEKFALVGSSGGGKTTILILDEATSALDTATEIKIQHSFDELSKGRTTLVIAHRLSTIKNADTIAVVNEKGIVETGNHDEPYEKKGAYYSLYTAQKQV